MKRVILMAVFLLISSSYGKHKKTTDEPPFQYEAGSENIEKGCEGKLVVLKEWLKFRCPGGNREPTLFRDHLDAISARRERGSPGHENSVEPKTSAHQGERKQVLYRSLQ